jgi:hypothetical protein
MRHRAFLTVILILLVLAACAPPPAVTPTPTVAPTAAPATPVPTPTPDPLSTNRWGSLAVADPGFSIRFPPGWNATQAELDADMPMQGMDLAGPEGRIELRWGTGFGGACPRYSALPTAAGLLPVCRVVGEDGVQRWEQIYTELKTATFAARAETAGASEESAELVRRILATLDFDDAAVAPTPETTRAPATAPGEIVVDNRSFTLAGDWYYFDGGQSYGGECLVALPGLDASARARPALPGAGLYEVYGWWCGNPNADQTRKGALRVHRSANDPAPEELVVDYTSGAGEWVNLGAYNLQSGAFVEALSMVDGSVPVDAFRFVPRGPTATEVPATPAATPGPIVSNHPPSALEQVAKGDLAGRLALNDPFYTSMTMNTTDMVFDDCADFPRQGCGGERKGWEAIVAYQGITLTYRISDDYSLLALAGADAWLDPWTIGQEHPQRVFGRGSSSDGSWAVHYRPDNTWRALYYGTETTAPRETRLTAEQGALLRALAPKYSTITIRTQDGGGLTFYGLGPTVAPTEEDRAALAQLAQELSQ